MIKRSILLKACIMSLVLAVLAGGASVAQQPMSTDIWQLAPPNSLVVAAFDLRPENASVQVLTNAQTPEARELRAQQHAALRKAIEDFATLFGISLDFAKDIDSWAGQQYAFVLFPDEKGQPQPAFLVACKDASTANGALQKLLAPWERIGEVGMQLESNYTISSFKTKDKGVEVYASAAGPVVAISTSKSGLIQALKGGGFAAGSPADKMLRQLSSSLFYAFVDPALLKSMKIDIKIPVTAVGLGVSAVETGMKLRILGLPSDEGTLMLKQMLQAQQSGGLVTNPGIPSASLIAASFPNVSSFVAMAGMAGAAKSPIFSTAEAISDMQVSAAMTAVLPSPAGVASAMAESDQAAADKLAKITTGLNQAKIPTKPAPLSGINATAIQISKDRKFYLAQEGKYVLLGTDAQSLTSAVSAIRSGGPALAQSGTYKETMAALGDSNLLTVYVNLAPIQGLGYLLDGIGISQLTPLHNSIAKGLENLQALGIGAGYNGEFASITMFLRAKPGIGPGAGSVAIAGTAIGAAVLFPVFARAREAARAAQCQSNLKELALAAEMYASDHGGVLPISTKWRTQLEPYIKGELSCPSDCSIYAYNKNLSGIKESKIEYPSETVMFFEADPDLPNATGSRADAILPHNGMGSFAYADGHVERLSEVPPQSQWVPYAAKPVQKAPVKKVPAGKIPVRAKKHR